MSDARQQQACCLAGSVHRHCWSSQPQGLPIFLFLLGVQRQQRRRYRYQQQLQGLLIFLVLLGVKQARFLLVQDVTYNVCCLQTVPPLCCRIPPPRNSYRLQSLLPPNYAVTSPPTIFVASKLRRGLTAMPPHAAASKQRLVAWARLKEVAHVEQKKRRSSHRFH